jgi:hypothetical protein
MAGSRRTWAATAKAAPAAWAAAAKAALAAGATAAATAATVAASLGACSTCPTGACPPVCVVTRGVVLLGGNPSGDARAAFSGADLAVVYGDLNAGTLFARLTQDGALRFAPIPVGADATLGVVSDAAADTDAVFQYSSDGLRLHHLDPLGAMLDDIDLAMAFSFATYTPTDVVPDGSGGFVLLAHGGADVFLQRFDAAGAPAGDAVDLGPADPGPLALARAPDGTFGVAARAPAAAGLLWASVAPDAFTAPATGLLDQPLAPSGGFAIAPTDGAGFLVAWGNPAAEVRAHETLDASEAAAVTLARDAPDARPLLARAGSGLLVVAWVDADAEAHAAAVGDDDVPRGPPADLGPALDWYDLVPTAAGVALVWAPLPATGEADVVVSFLECR